MVAHVKALFLNQVTLNNYGFNIAVLIFIELRIFVIALRKNKQAMHQILLQQIIDEVTKVAI
jgi:hypothetical protein